MAKMPATHMMARASGYPHCSRCWREARQDFLPCKRRACWIRSRSRVSRQLFSPRRVAAAGPSRHWSCRRTPPPPARLRAATATAIPTVTASAVKDAAIPTLPVLPPPPAAHVLDHAARMAVTFATPLPLPSLEFTLPSPSYSPLDKPLLQLRGLCHFMASFRHVAVDHHCFLISAAVDTD